MREFDFIVLGSGIAGLSFALKAAQKGSVAIVTKRSSSDSNTAWAQGGVACVMTGEDSFDLHVCDTLAAGAGLCHEDIVRSIVTEGPTRIKGKMATARWSLISGGKAGIRNAASCMPATPPGERLKPDFSSASPSIPESK
jgi:succinate dehydrogenase/fumarate reductase flavoprotein subunit